MKLVARLGLATGFLAVCRRDRSPLGHASEFSTRRGTDTILLPNSAARRGDGHLHRSLSTQCRVTCPFSYTLLTAHTALLTARVLAW